MGKTRRWPRPGSAWDRSSQSRRRFVLALLVLTVIFFVLSITVRGTWWSVAFLVCLMAGLLTTLLTPRVGEQGGRP